jgi:hypothetical protein
MDASTAAKHNGPSISALQAWALAQSPGDYTEAHGYHH